MRMKQDYEPRIRYTATDRQSAHLCLMRPPHQLDAGQRHKQRERVPAIPVPRVIK
jgi:hypothetical protein